MSEWIRLDRDTTADVPAGSGAALRGRSAEDLRRVAVTVAAEAAEHVRQARAEGSDRDGRVKVEETKSSDVDPVTAIDRSSERLIRRRIAELTDEGHGPDDVLGEEGGGVPVDPAQPGASAEALDRVTWIVDPVDGTVNLVYGIPVTAVSVAACIGGIPVAGAVADISRGTVHSACSGGDRLATASGEPAGGEEPAGETRWLAGSLATALVGTGFSYLAARRRGQAELLGELIDDIRDIRRMGSAALDLCAVALGTLDAYYEHGLGPWDHAAGCLIAARAGAVVNMPPLGCGYDEGLSVVAAAPDIAGELEGRIPGTMNPTPTEPPARGR